VGEVDCFGYVVCVFDDDDCCWVLVDGEVLGLLCFVLGIVVWYVDFISDV